MFAKTNPACHVSEDQFPQPRCRVRHVRRHCLVLRLPPGHVASPDPRMTQKIYGWLKPGGLFVFCTVQADTAFAAQWIGNDVTSMSKDRRAECFREVGFEIVHQKVSVFVSKAAEAEPEEGGEEHQLFMRRSREIRLESAAGEWSESRKTNCLPFRNSHNTHLF
jgi:hypothetical protein